MIVSQGKKIPNMLSLNQPNLSTLLRMNLMSCFEIKFPSDLQSMGVGDARENVDICSFQRYVYFFWLLFYLGSRPSHQHKI